MNIGDAFINVDPGSLSHLWVIIAKAAEHVAIVNFNSRPSFSPDDTCIINEGEHPFVVRDTIVNYRLATLVVDAVLESAKAHGYIDMQDAVSDELLRRIQEGALSSPYTPQKIQTAVTTELGQ